MLRILRAFAWMRWRVLMNSLERTGARDTVERLSLAIEQIGPIIALALLLPSAIGLAGLGTYAGYWLPGPDRVVVFDALRVLLLIASGFCVLGPLLMPSMERTNTVRLLLLPIPRRTLYVAHAASAFGDPWVLLAVAAVTGVSAGLLLAGAVVAAALALLAGASIVMALVGLTTLCASLLHLVFRDRRRGELLALIFILVVPILGLLPSVMGPQSQTREERRAERQARAERRARGEESRNERGIRIALRAYGFLPSELYVRTTREAAHGEHRTAVASLAGLGLSAGILHAFGILSFSGLLRSPGSSARRQAARTTWFDRGRIPGVSRATMAVARAQLCLTLRTPRGRSMLLSPLLVFGMFAILLRRNAGVFDAGFATLSNGLGLATVSAGTCLLAILPFAVNQFAIDRTGLTLVLLSPLGRRELLVGKAIANGVLVSASTLFCAAASWMLLPGGHPALWINLLLAVAATYALAAPGVAALSAVFPRPVDLNSIGRGSNAHGAANLLGLLLFAAASVPSILVTLVATGLLRRPVLAPILMLGWFGICWLSSGVLFEAAALVFDRRRENLGLQR